MSVSNLVKNKEVLDLIFNLSGSLSDLNFTWSKELRNKFNKVVRSLEKEI